MPDGTFILSRWISHVRSLGGKPQGAADPNMRFRHGVAPVLELPSLYIIGDLRRATECYLSAHGSAAAEHYFVDKEYFTVPGGVAIRFYQPDGYILSFSSAALRDGPPIPHPDPTGRLYTGGDTCPNYALGKDQGLWLGGGAAFAHQLEMDYASSQRVAADLGIVLVTVRRRWFHTALMLGDAIAAVRKAAPGLSIFNCLFCRGGDRQHGRFWDAARGAWRQA